MSSPLTAGVQLSQTKKRARLRTRLRIDAFILSDASASDLRKLGVEVGAQAGDIFTGHMPIAAVPRLLESSAVRYIELARMNTSCVDRAVSFANMHRLHKAKPPVKGAGVIIGVLDSKIDIYHPDFCTRPNHTKIRFLWDQNLERRPGESGPPTGRALPGFMPHRRSAYGVEYDNKTIDRQLESAHTKPYEIVRHRGDPNVDHDRHGTAVAAIAAGTGRASAQRRYAGAAPAAELIFVSLIKPDPIEPVASSTALAEGFAYVFARAALLGMPCVVNRSGSDNQGPHDGTTLGERFLDNLLLVPGRAITLAAGNSNDDNAHATGRVAEGETVDLQLQYQDESDTSDDIEIWYDGHDLFDITVKIPTEPPTVIGPLSPGDDPKNSSVMLSNGVKVTVTSVLNDGRNGDNLISIIIEVPNGQYIPDGFWHFKLTGTTVINGIFHAWVDRNNRGIAEWQEPHVQKDALTLGVPSTARRAITVGNHTEDSEQPEIAGDSGRGPTRDGRIKPEIAAVGTDVTSACLRDITADPVDYPYESVNGTSASAPLVAGACALLFESRGARLSCADIKQILQNSAGTTGVGAIPNNEFGFGHLQMDSAGKPAQPRVDVWLRDHPRDTGVEPSAGGNVWLSPDIEILDRTGKRRAAPKRDPDHRFNNIVRVTVRNRGTEPARNTQVFLYWAEAATNLPFPRAWNSTGIYAGASRGFLRQENRIVVPLLRPAGKRGDSAQVQFECGIAPSTNDSAENYFSLLVRLENEKDPSQVSDGGPVIVNAKNNMAMRNVHIQRAADVNTMRFDIVGSLDIDGLLIESELNRGTVELSIPVEALLWRDAALIEQVRCGYSSPGTNNVRPLHSLNRKFSGDRTLELTDVVGAASLHLQHGIATITMQPNKRLHVPAMRIEMGGRVPASLKVSGAGSVRGGQHVHTAQLSGGRVIGGLSLELH
jgi:subtilisin family serine protease